MRAPSRRVVLRSTLLTALAAFSALTASAVALPFAGCGDDTVAPLPDGSADATTPDATAGDGSAADGPGGDSADGGCTPYDASQLDGAAVQAGRTLALALKCAKCHGDQLSGNPNGVTSPQTEGGLAYPPNLTPDPVTGLGCWTDQGIENAFLHGLDDEGQPLCPPMPRFADAGVDAAGADDLLAFLRSLPPWCCRSPTRRAAPSAAAGATVEAATPRPRPATTPATRATQATTPAMRVT